MNEPIKSMNENKKRTRGRPSGSLSFTNITLAELNARFGQDQVLPVGRIFLEKGKLTPKQISENVGAEIQKRVSNNVFVAPATEPSSMVEMTLQA